MRTLPHLAEYRRRRPAARPTARRNSPSAAPPVAFPRKNSPSTAQKRRIWGVLSALGELFRAYTTKHRDIETNNTTAHPQQRTTETAITSAPDNCTKNAHFSPAKAITVSVPHRHKQAKATAVSGHRATSPAAPTRGTRRRRNQDGIKTTRQAANQQPSPTGVENTGNAWLRRPWAADPGRASRRRAERSSPRGRLAGGPTPTGTPSSPARQHNTTKRGRDRFPGHGLVTQSAPLHKAAAPPAIRRSCPRGPRPRRGQPRGGRRGRGTGSRTRSPGPHCGRSGSTAGRHRARHTRRA